MTDTPPLARRLFAELLGSAFLAALVVGSGIAGQTLSPGYVGLQLFENAAATAMGLVAIILMFGPVSGAHFNPVVSIISPRSVDSTSSVMVIPSGQTKPDPPFIGQTRRPQDFQVNHRRTGFKQPSTMSETWSAGNVRGCPVLRQSAPRAAVS